ncbi:hypothetical protein [Bradyrhizobium sp. BR13661]|jgi:hypothetical protein|uniref:hypothetical protein n=1 Tax=Bradyrhizobium sp. BR13661 TaxID=2940622 RepID=UPI002473916E|nr:hypothetical protein [Bradyrhizobium sp. BR13661]MDH6263467.1 hypothetical protein [Bradyrhizobium sp. BR13661]
MTFFRRSLKALVIAVAMAAVAGAVLLAARPQPIESTVLGAAWECTQTAFILTSCAPRTHVIPAVETSGKEALRPSRG